MGDAPHRRRTRKQAPEIDTTIDWSQIDYVVGTRADVTRTGINRPCTRCTLPVFTARRYPHDVSMVCEVCALELVEEEREVGKRAAEAPAAIRRNEPLPDPWQRSGGVAPRRPGPRKLRQPPPPGGDG